MSAVPCWSPPSYNIFLLHTSNNRMKTRFSLLCAITSSLLTTFLLLMYVAVAQYSQLEQEIENHGDLREQKLQVPLRIYSSNQILIAEYGDKKRTPVSIDKVPKLMQRAFLASEDDRFYQHPGVDYQGIIRAAAKMVQTGRKRQGGSTITMQVARNYFLTPEKTFTRKIKEIFLSLKIEKELTKDEILELYLNKIYLGQRAYGVAAAAQIYFNKQLSELTLAEMATIAGLPKAPSRDNPISNPSRATQRRNYVLRRLFQLNDISEQDYIAASNTDMETSKQESIDHIDSAYFSETIRSLMQSKYPNNLYTSGLKVSTTLDIKHQKQANRALRNNLHAYDNRHGFRGAETTISWPRESDSKSLEEELSSIQSYKDLIPGVVTEVTDLSAQIFLNATTTVKVNFDKMKIKAPYKTADHVGDRYTSMTQVLRQGDIIRIYIDEKQQAHLRQLPRAEGAFVTLNPNSGAVTSIVGGYSFKRSKFNRATQALRQPGSGIKPFIYAAALDKGYTTATLINDSPVVYMDNSSEDYWKPQNYSHSFFGPTPLRTGLIKSRNLVSIRLLRDIGIDYTRTYLTRFGFKKNDLAPSLSMVLGTNVTTPLKMASAYAVFANGGYRVTPYFIDTIKGYDDNVVFSRNNLLACPECLPHQPEVDISNPLPQKVAPRVLSTETHYLMDSLLRDVVARGTARKARVLSRDDIGGKTGTTNNQKDAWFFGFHPSLVAIAWVGFDTPQPLGKGETGGRAALPMWIEFMKEILPDLPRKRIRMPNGVVMAKIDPASGKLARPNQRNAIYEVFKKQTVPTEFGDVAPSSPAGRQNSPEDHIDSQLF